MSNKSLMKKIEEKKELDTASRKICSFDPAYPCTYYHATQTKILCGGGKCEKTCCYACEEKITCGWACNACRRIDDTVARNQSEHKRMEEKG